MADAGQIRAMVDAYVAEATKETTSGGWVWYQGDIARFIPPAEQAGRMSSILKELWRRPEVADASVTLCGIHGMVIDCAFHLKFCPETDSDDDPRSRHCARSGYTERKGD